MTLVVAILLSGGIALIAHQFDLGSHISDFYSRWYAANQWVTTGRNIYDPRNAQEVVVTVQNQPPVEQGGFYYPAHLLVVIGPLAPLPYPVAGLVWGMAVQVFYLAAIWLACRSFGWPESGNGYGAIFILSILFIPNLQHAIWKQFSTIGALGLMLCWVMLMRKQHVLAGLFALSLTIKPQVTLLALGFLLVWALMKRDRWPFLGAFAAGGAGLWLVFQLFMPGWVAEFLRSVQAYQSLTLGYTYDSVVNTLWNPFYILTILLAGAWLFVVARARNAEPDSAMFVGGVSASIMIGGLIVPLVGMMHEVIYPVLIVALASHLKRIDQRWYRVLIALTVIIYLFSWVGFGVGLISDVYGLHIALSELALKTIGTTVLLVFAGRVVLSQTENVQVAAQTQG